MGKEEWEQHREFNGLLMGYGWSDYDRKVFVFVIDLCGCLFVCVGTVTDGWRCQMGGKIKMRTCLVW